MIVLIFSQTECKYIAFILIKKHLHDFFQKNVFFYLFSVDFSITDSISPMLMFLPTIFPDLSINTVAGIEFTAYSFAPLHFQPCKSEICFQVRSCLAIALFQASSLSSSDTPRISKRFPLLILYSSFISGNDWMHGTHHEAQKSTKT